MASTFLTLSQPRDAMNFIEELTKNACLVQDQVLEEILKRNANTEYLKQFLNGKLDKESFKEKVPVVDYEDILPFTERIANDSNQSSKSSLTAEPIVELFRSSGTSGGRHKLFPVTNEELNRRCLFNNLSLGVLKTHIHGLDDGKRMVFFSVVHGIKTTSGLIEINALSGIYKDQKSKTHPLNVFNNLTSPDDVISCTDMKQNIYMQLLCGLVQRDQVVSVGAHFPPTLIRAMKFLQKNWEELCSNIRTGLISDWITDPSGRKATSTILSKEMPDLANTIEEICRGKSWEGIIKKLWPKAKMIQTKVTGSIAQYIPILEFYGGGLPLVSMKYTCSECSIGINLKPLSKPSDILYTLMPNMAYFEFIEIYQQGNTEMSQKVVDLSSLKIGQQYELVVTTSTGLYRYRVGDILMVIGFHNNTPQFRFLQRKNVILSIHFDKTTEEDLFKAIRKAMEILEPLGFFLHDYTSYNETSLKLGHYVLFWELQHAEKIIVELDAFVMEKCCALLEQSLDIMYKKVRNMNDVIGPLEIKVVKQGTFDALMDFYLSQDSSSTQYKTPRTIKSEQALKILNTMVIGSYSSKTIPNI